MRLDEIANGFPGPLGQRIDFEDLIFPIPFHHLYSGSAGSLAPPDSRYPNIDIVQCFPHGIDLAQLTTQVRILFPQLGPMLKLLFFRGQCRTSIDEIEVRVAALEFVDQAVGFREEKHRVQVDHVQGLLMSSVHFNQGAALHPKTRRDDHSLVSKSLYGPFDELFGRTFLSDGELISG